MKTVLLFARDPGGTNVILPLYEKMKVKYQVCVYAKDFAVKRFQNAGVPVRDLGEECGKGSFIEIKSFLKRVKPQILITGTSLDDFTERYFWKASKELHIKSFAILDQWMNLGIRFSDYDYSQAETYASNPIHPYLPDRIFVMDVLAKELLQNDGIEEERIVITGQPHFDTVQDKFNQAERIYDNQFWNVVYVSEPIFQDYDQCDQTSSYWGFNEKTIFQSLYANLTQIADKFSCKIRLIIRPHPRENAQNWNQVIEKLENRKISVECNMTDDSFSVMKSADLICGMSSMFLLESIICGKPVLSIEIGLKRENPFVLDRIGSCKSILSEKELLENLVHVYEHKENACLFEFIRDASKRVLQLVEEEMAK